MNGESQKNRSFRIPYALVQQMKKKQKQKKQTVEDTSLSVLSLPVNQVLVYPGILMVKGDVKKTVERRQSPLTQVKKEDHNITSVQKETTIEKVVHTVGPILLVPPLLIGNALFYKKKEEKKQPPTETVSNIEKPNTPPKEKKVSVVINEQPVTVKEEQGKVVKEMQDTVIEKQQELINLATEIKELKQTVETVQNTEEIEKITEKLAILRKKVANLQEKIEVLKENYDFSELKEAFVDTKLAEQIEQMEQVTTQEERIKLAELTQAELQKLEDIVTLKTQEQRLSKSLEIQKKYVIQRENHFCSYQNKVTQVNEIDQKMNQQLLQQMYQVEQIAAQASKVETEIRDELYIKSISKVIFHALELPLGFLTMPFTNFHAFGIIGGALIMNNAIKGLRENIIKTGRKEIYYRFKDVAQEIATQRGLINRTDFLVTDSLKQIRLLKMEYAEFAPYELQVPEYHSVKKRLEELEGMLEKKQEQMKQMKEQLEVYEKQNQAKVKKYGGLKRIE